MTSKRPELSGLPNTSRVNRGPLYTFLYFFCELLAKPLSTVQSVNPLQGASFISFHSSHELPPSTPPQKGIDGNEFINAST